MKKINIIILLILISFNAFAQNTSNRERPNRDKIKALKIAHITEKLNLTEDEAQSFWPVYNDNQNKREQFHESKFSQLKPKDIQALSNNEAQYYLKKLIAFEEERQQQERTYFKKLTKILPAKKILLLKNADRSFKRKIIEEYRGRHKKTNPGKGQKI